MLPTIRLVPIPGYQVTSTASAGRSSASLLHTILMGGPILWNGVAMERRFRVRLEGLRGDAAVPAGLLRGAVARLEAFLQPFAAALRSAEQRTNARHYVQGLLSELGRKDAESIAYLHDRERQGL